MRNSEGIRRIVDEIEYLRAKREQIARMTARLLITHGNHIPGTGCQPGETVEQASLLVGMDTFPLHLSQSALLIADLIARKKPLLLTARQIEHMIASDPFCIYIGVNAPAVPRGITRLTRRVIKVYIRRIREQLKRALRRAELRLQPNEVLVSETTDLANVVAYRIGIPCEFVHLDLG